MCQSAQKGPNCPTTSSRLLCPLHVTAIAAERGHRENPSICSCAFSGCVSSLGVYDQHGNAAEHMNLPLGPEDLASGARVLTTLLYALKDRNLDSGLATLCLGGGDAVALSVSRSNK